LKINTVLPAVLFAQHFSKKVASIREATANYAKPQMQPRSVEAPLCEFRLATLTEVTAVYHIYV